MTQSKGTWRKVLLLAIVGGLAFWVTNFAISRTPIAAEYRAALSISYLPMIVESLIGGLIVGFCVSYFLLRFFEKDTNKKFNSKIPNTNLHHPNHFHNPD